MRISDVSIRNPVFAWMLMAALIIFGAISFTRMGVSQMPDVDFPVVNVSVGLEGAAPEIIETSVIDPIESSVMTVQGVRSISSNAKQGSASITVEFELEKDIDAAVNEIQTKVAQAQRLLPKDIDPPVITKTNPDDQPIMWLAATTTNSDPRYLMTFARDYLKDQFTTVTGVGDVFLGGYVDPNLRVWVQPDKLRDYNISINDIMNSIQSEHTEVPGGQIQTEEKNFNVRTLGEAKTLPEFENIIISGRAGGQNLNPFNSVKLKQVASVEEGLADITRISRFNKERALGLGIRKQKGSNAVQVAKNVKAKMRELEGSLPKDVKVNLNFDSTQFIEKAVHELNRTLVIAAILTALACWIFLGSWSATLNILLSIPTSIIGSFTALYFLGFTLNTFTLLGLALSIGIVVDDSIMVLENIFRHRELKKGRVEAAIVGSREITFAAMAATVAIIAIFLPVAFMKGVIGKFFLQFGVTISFAVFLSLIEALTITPMRCASFLEIGERTSKIGRGFEVLMSSLERFYHKSLTWSLERKWLVLAASIVFMVVSFKLVSLLTKEFSPPQDQSLFLIRIQAPIGSSLVFTDEKSKMIEDYLLKRPEIKQVYVAVGGFGGGSGETNTSMFFVTMKQPSERPRDEKTGKKISQQDFMGFARKEIAKLTGVKVVMQDLSMRGFSSGRGFPIEFTIRGANWEKLAELTKSFEKEMEESGLMTDVDSNYNDGMPELQVTPDRAQAGLHGVSIQSIGKTVNAMIGGVKVGQYPKDGYRYDIRVQVDPKYDRLGNLKNLTVANSRGNLVPLSQLVKQEVRPSLQQISRIDRQRAISMFANLKPGASQEAALDLVKKMGANLPNGYSVAFAGSAKSMKESFESLVFALVMGILVAYMILAAQFNSFIDPLSVLMALPFSVSGAFIGLLITGNSINMYSMIGLILLMGIVKKNSILLVEFANQVRTEKELAAKESLIAACPVRLRPILMTSFATIVGAIPEAVSFGAGGETMRPMAVAVIGGVFVSTLLTLYVVPSVYLILSRFDRRTRNEKEIRLAFEGIQE